MHTLLALLLFVVVFVVPNQVSAEDTEKEPVEKRQVSVLARDGNLPYEGKRYVGKEPLKSKISGNEWDRNSDPSVFLATNKRYVGALAKTGDLAQFKQMKRNDDVDTLIDYLRKGEEIRRLRLDAVKEEMLREAEEDYEADAEKRSLSSLARAGEFPMRASKRGGIASMARSGLFKGSSGFNNNDELGKRGISSLARNGQLPSFGKRGGVSSLMRNGFSHQKRAYGTDLDDFMFGEFDVLDKRNVASLARDYSLPNMGKKNIASFAKNGWRQNYGFGPKRSAYEYEDLADIDDSKRNVPSLLRNRMSPLAVGKRYLGAFVASNKLPYSRQSSDDFKRNIGSILRSSEFQPGRTFGKRDWDDEDDMSEEMANEYVLPQLSGPLGYALNDDSKDFIDYSNPDDIDEQKRHIGSVLSQKSFMRKKKSITPEDQLEEQQPTTSSPTKSQSDENKMNNDIQRNNIRQKREAFADISDTDEYTMPVLQNTQSMEYEDENRDNNMEETTRKKRYFGALARSGWLPNNHYFKGAVSKRHIGALARLGWLPSFRHVRAYSRFGRDVRSPCKRSSPPISFEGRSSEGWREDPGWEVASRGTLQVQQPQLWSSSGPLEDEDENDDVGDDMDPVKRYLLLPALDNILLRRQPVNWIH